MKGPCIKHWHIVDLQVQREMCSASAEFEDFVLQFMDRYVEFGQVIHQAGFSNTSPVISVTLLHSSYVQTLCFVNFNMHFVLSMLTTLITTTKLWLGKDKVHSANNIKFQNKKHQTTLIQIGVGFSWCLLWGNPTAHAYFEPGIQLHQFLMDWVHTDSRTECNLPPLFYFSHLHDVQLVCIWISISVSNCKVVLICQNDVAFSIII